MYCNLKFERNLSNMEASTYKMLKYSSSSTLGDRTPVNPIDGNVLQDGIRLDQWKAKCNDMFESTGISKNYHYRCKNVGQ